MSQTRSDKRIKGRIVKIQSYLDSLSDYEKSPLHFGGNVDKNYVYDIHQHDFDTLDSLVRLIIDLSALYCSRYSNNILQCSAGRRRSAVDIWRHAIYVDSSITIFDIMESIYRIRDGLTGGYCGVVHRTVFRPRTDANHWSIYNPSSFVCREFGIKFSTWKKLHE